MGKFWLHRLIAIRYLPGEDVTETSGHTVSLEIYKKFLGAWIYVPCVEGVGSCTLSNICDKIHTGDDCPLAPWYAGFFLRSFLSLLYEGVLGAQAIDNSLSSRVASCLPFMTGECRALAPSTPAPTPSLPLASASTSRTPTSAGSPTYAQRLFITNRSRQALSLRIASPSSTLVCRRRGGGGEHRATSRCGPPSTTRAATGLRATRSSPPSRPTKRRTQR
jgi:hypothetical protein